MDLYLYEVTVSAQVFTLREARREYARLRKEANRKIKALGRSEFSNLRSYKNYREGFAALPKNAREGDVRKALYEVARFTSLKTSSVSGAREARRKFVETMQSEGYGFINERNAAEFGEFMKEVKTHQDYRGRDSDHLANLYKTAKEKRIDPLSLAENYEKWYDNEKAYNSASRSRETQSFDQFMERVNNS